MMLFVGCGDKKRDVSEDAAYSGEVYPENGLPKNEKVVLRIIYPEQGYGSEFMEQGIKSFEEKFPNVKFEVRFVLAGSDSYNKIVKSLIQANDDKKMFDWFYQVPDVNRMVECGKLENQDDLWEKLFYDAPNIKISDGIYVEKRELFGLDGHCYAIPNHMAIVGLFYNRGLFKQLGLEERSANWNGFLELCKKIKATGIYPMVMAGKYPEYFQYGWGAIPYEIEGDHYWDAVYYAKSDLYLYKGYVTMLERLEDFTKRGYLHPGTVSFDHTQSQMEFLQGKAAMITNGAWIAKEMEEVIPKGFDWGFMPFPGNDPGQQQVILVSHGSNGYIWKNRPEINKKWAKEFNRWLLNLELQKIVARNGSMPVRKDFPDSFSDFSPSLRAAIQTIKEKNIRVLNRHARGKVLKGAEASKIAKIQRDCLVAIVTEKINADTAAKKTNRQYMKALREQGN
jgi:N-acetylglucosamine transport system substrate-binding protein